MNCYLSIEVVFDVIDFDDVIAGDVVEIVVNFECEIEGEIGLVFVL